MFDIVRSSFDLGPDFTECECQTKDIEELGGSLTFYWLSPDGHLYTPNYDGTADFEIANDPHASLFNSFRIVETGKKGTSAGCVHQQDHQDLSCEACEQV